MRPGTASNSGLPLASSQLPTNRRRWLLLSIVAVLASAALGVAGYFVRVELRAQQDQREAQAAIDRRDFKAALAHLERCREAWPSSGEIAFLTARTARRAGEFRSAEHHLQDAERLGWPDNALLLEHALLLAQQSEFATSEKYLLSCVRSDHPDSALILEVVAPVYVDRFNAPLASEMLEAWVRWDAKNHVPHLLRGEIAKRLNRRPEALAALREACRLAPEDAEVRERLAEMLVDTKNFVEAQGHLEWLLRRGEPNRNVRLNNAACRAGLGDDDVARDILDELLRETPHDGQVLAERAKVELEGGRPAQAEPWYRRASEREPFDIVICHNFARCLEQLGKTEEAGRFRERAKKIEESMKRMEQLMRAIALSPYDPELRREAGEIMLRNGQVKAGLRWLETALEQEPNHARAHETLAEHYRSIGEHAKADFHRRLSSLNLR